MLDLSPAEICRVIAWVGRTRAGMSALCSWDRAPPRPVDPGAPTAKLSLVGQRPGRVASAWPLPSSAGPITMGFPVADRAGIAAGRGGRPRRRRDGSVRWVRHARRDHVYASGPVDAIRRCAVAAPSGSGDSARRPARVRSGPGAPHRALRSRRTFRRRRGMRSSVARFGCGSGSTGDVTVLVLQNEEVAPPGLLAKWAEDRGIELDVVHAYREGGCPSPQRMRLP
jgi:hypothetical protein